MVHLRVTRGDTLDKFVWFCVAMICAIGSHQRAAAASQSQQFGILMRTMGVVSIQGSPVSPGATVMPRDVITTGPHSAANFSLRQYSMTVLPGTQVSMLAAILVT